MIVKYRNEDISFNELLSLDKFLKIQDSYTEPSGIVDEKWWYEKSDFGIYFLEEVGLGEMSSPNLTGITDEEWKLFHPVFENYFPTSDEYKCIIANIFFLHGLTLQAIENQYYVKYLLMRQLGKLKLEDINNMYVKDGLMMFYYSSNDMLFSIHGENLYKRDDKQDQMVS